MVRPKTDGLTPRQRETLEEICRCVDVNGYPPTVQELADLFEVTPPSIHDRLNQLVHKGYLQRSAKKARGLTVVRRPEEKTERLIAVPLIGTVAAGVPILACENVIGEVLISESVARGGEYFALNVQGDSMINAGIQEGDAIIVRRQALAENGEIVVAMLDGEATVKRLHIDRGTIELRAENSAYDPIEITPDADFRILGKVTASRSRA
jgi:repressor LexA